MGGEGCESQLVTGRIEGFIIELDDGGLWFGEVGIFFGDGEIEDLSLNNRIIRQGITKKNAGRFIGLTRAVASVSQLLLYTGQPGQSTLSTIRSLDTMAP